MCYACNPCAAAEEVVEIYRRSLGEQTQEVPNLKARALNRRLVAFQYADCTTVGREFDFRETAANRAEQAFGEFGGDVLYAVGIGL